MNTGKTTKAASVPFRAADHLKSEAEIAAYIEEMLSEGDPRAMPTALRTVADAAGGIAALADKTGLSRETLHRTLSKKGNPRLDTLAVPRGLRAATFRPTETDRYRPARTWLTPCKSDTELCREKHAGESAISGKCPHRCLRD